MSRVVLALCAAALVCGAAAVTIPPPVPGLCFGGGGAIGCSFDATKIESMGVTINPMQPVIEMTWCDDTCYEPGHQYDPGCQYCTYTLPDYSNMTYRVPTNAMVLPYTESGGCYEQMTSDTVEDYNNLVGHTVGHSGWFHSWSKTTITFYHRYYENDNSLSLEYKFLIWHQLLIPSFIAKPTFEFQIAVDSLPSTYSNETYQGFIKQWGTHYMSNAYIGGSALLTAYFHSCFLEQYGGKFVSSESSSSFFGLFSHGSSNHHGFNNTDIKFKKWSKVEGKLVGGYASQYGILNWTNTMDAQECQNWEDTIKFDMAALKFSLTPLSDLFNDATKEANFQHALDVYGANVAEYNDNLVKSLVPKDPHIVPPWCTKGGPHPPSDAATAYKPRLGSADATLPGCPALPSEAEALAQIKAMRQ